MPDPRFFSTATALAPAELASIAEADLVEGTGTAEPVACVAAAEGSSDGRAVVFAGDEAFLDGVIENRPAACILPEKLLEKAQAAGLGETTLLIVSTNPRASFALVAARLHDSLAETMTGADQGPAPEIGEGSHIAPSAVIASGVIIGSGCHIGPNTVIGPGCVIGDNCHIAPSVTISHTVMGEGCRILSGARLGEAGFGFEVSGDRQLRVPQLGRVMLGREVEVGANSTIDRGALGDTVIGDFSKIDNLVQIGHNVVIGKRCALAAMCGISGSVTIGDGALLGGQVGVGDHVTIGAGAIIYACTALMKDVPPGEAWAGSPAKPARQFFKEVATLTRLAKKKTS